VVQKPCDVLHDEEAGPQQSDVPKELGHERIPLVVAASFSDPTEALAGRAANDSVGSLRPEEVAPCPAIEIGNAGLHRAADRKVSPVSGLQDGIDIDRS
jgi:hypothetical protein